MLPHPDLAAALAAAADPGPLLDEHGDRLLAAGHVRVVEAALAAVPPTPARSLLLAQARQVRGDGDGALECARPVGAAGPLPAALAWRLAMVRYQAGDPAGTLAACAGSTGGAAADEARLLALAANAHWMLGDRDATRAHAERAHAAATRSADPGALAAAHTALALAAMLAGDRRTNGRHWALAIEAADRAGDVLQAVRIRANRGSHLAEEGFPAEAAAELERAALLAEEVGYVVAAGLCRTNLGGCLLQLGRLGPAVAEFERGKEAFQVLGGRLIAYPLAGLGDAYRERGDLALARAAYEEAVASGSPADPQGWLPAVSGLARVVAVDDPAAAAELAADALATAREPERHRAQLVLGWLRLAAGAYPEAAALADEVAAAARRRRDRAALAEALELAAVSDRDADGRPDPRAAWLLDEALSVWRETGAQVAVHRVTYAKWRLFDGPDPGAAAELARLGVRVAGPHGAGLLDTVHRCAPLRVAIRVLGRFEVTRGGIPVADTEWQSRKARELLKMLVARRGRACPRSRLVELLWPGEDDPAVTGNRLSVVLATVRRVLDPVRALPAGHYLITEDGSVALAVHRIDVDVEAFLRDATDGLRSRSTEQLRRAAAAYRGDALEEDVYADWAHGLREEARAAGLAVLRALAADAETDEAVLLLLRLLDADPYDEPAHLALVAVLLRACRWGDAVRAYRCYAGRAAELGLDPAPVPGLPALPGHPHRPVAGEGAAGVRRSPAAR
jgi:DNA-binding SARP family transcriptional activator/tetratricopeptide (TPR) repeat protein